jgi:rod shape-determining protein MreD
MNAEAAFAEATRWASYLVPMTSTFMVAMFAVLPLPIPYYSGAAPALTLIAVYYWMVYRPDLMPTLGLFVLGVVNDALAGTPLGVSSLIYLVAQVAILNQRRFLVGRPFWFLWSGFALIAPLALLFRWVAISVLREAPLAPLATVASGVLTILLFPLVAYLLVRLQRGLLGAPPEGWSADA